jgi:hypothetical protein
MKWVEIEELHARAAAEFAAAAEKVPAERWLLPRAEGKWSPAEIVEHLTLAYEVLLRELDGGPGMKLRTSWWQRIVLRFTMVPKILRGDGFPEGARSPRETRPPSANPDQRAAVEKFRSQAAAFASKAAAAPSKRVTHAYFGKSSMPEALLFCVRHLEHHVKQLPPS